MHAVITVRPSEGSSSQRPLVEVMHVPAAVVRLAQQNLAQHQERAHRIVQDRDNRDYKLLASGVSALAGGVAITAGSCLWALTSTSPVVAGAVIGAGGAFLVAGSGAALCVILATRKALRIVHAMDVPAAVALPNEGRGLQPLQQNNEGPEGQ